MLGREREALKEILWGRCRTQLLVKLSNKFLEKKICGDGK
jgi:hypothetical protein